MVTTQLINFTPTMLPAINNTVTDQSLSAAKVTDGMGILLCTVSEEYSAVLCILEGERVVDNLYFWQMNLMIIHIIVGIS